MYTHAKGTFDSKNHPMVNGKSKLVTCWLLLLTVGALRVKGDLRGLWWMIGAGFDSQWCR